MPRRDGTGPNGYGPLTGRRMGNCARGYGYGQGLGRNQAFYPETKENLKREKDLVEQRLKDLDKKLEDM
jgi:hypothetical protein